MTNALMASLEPQLNADFPDMSPGDTVRVHQKITEGRNERIQVFQGVVIAMRGGTYAGCNLYCAPHRLAWRWCRAHLPAL